MMVLLRVWDVGIISEFDTEVLVYQKESSKDAQVFSEFYNDVFAHTWLEDGVGILHAHDRLCLEGKGIGSLGKHSGMLSSQGESRIGSGEHHEVYTWGLDTWFCSKCLWFYVAFIWKLGSLLHLTHLLVLTPHLFFLHVFHARICLCICSLLPVPSSIARCLLGSQVFTPRRPMHAPLSNHFAVTQWPGFLHAGFQSLMKMPSKLLVISLLDPMNLLV